MKVLKKLKWQIELESLTLQWKRLPREKLHASRIITNEIMEIFWK